MKGKIGAIVQARMSSWRFPNKVLYEIAGKPLLQYLLERLEHCHCLDAIVVATSMQSSDTPVAEYCMKRGVGCHRGPLSNVAARFKEVLDEYQFDGFVRVSGDSPLLDQKLIDKAVGIFLRGDVDIVTNVLRRTYPRGQSVEVLRADTFGTVYESMREDEDLEHVTRFFYNHPENFRIHSFALAENLNWIQLSVDTRQDMETFAAIVSRMRGPHWEYGLEEIIEIYHQVASCLGRRSSA